MIRLIIITIAVLYCFNAFADTSVKCYLPDGSVDYKSVDIDYVYMDNYSTKIKLKNGNTVKFSQSVQCVTVESEDKD